MLIQSRSLFAGLAGAYALARSDAAFIAQWNALDRSERTRLRRLVRMGRPIDPAELVPMDQVESRYIARVMESVNANKTTAAKVLGFDRKTLYRKLKRYGIEIEPKDESAS